MATINLGSIKFNWKGAYAGGTAYAVDDVVSSGGSSYVCILASTGNATSNGTYWEQMSSAGTDGSNGSNGSDGTDLSTTITTQGDLLYRDGSGLQRLGAGTNGQALLTGGTGANPSWGDVSSGVDFIAEGSFSSVSEIVLANSLWDATKYRFHEVYIRVKNGSTNSGNGYLQYSSNGGSSYLSNSISSGSFEYNSISASASYRDADNGNIAVVAGDGINTTYGSLWMTFGGLNTTEQKQFQSVWVRANHDGSSRMKSNNTFCLIENSTASSTIKITGFTSTPTFTGTYKIFGRK